MLALGVITARRGSNNRQVLKSSQDLQKLREKETVLLNKSETQKTANFVSSKNRVWFKHDKIKVFSTKQEG